MKYLTLLIVLFCASCADRPAPVAAVVKPPAATVVRVTSAPRIVLPVIRDDAEAVRAAIAAAERSAIETAATVPDERTATVAARVAAVRETAGALLGKVASLEASAEIAIAAKEAAEAEIIATRESLATAQERAREDAAAAAASVQTAQGNEAKAAARAEVLEKENAGLKANSWRAYGVGAAGLLIGGLMFLLKLRG